MAESSSPRKRQRLLQSSTKLDDLPPDIIRRILEYGTTTESWSISRCNKQLYATANPLIYPLFHAALNKRMLEISPVIDPRKFLPGSIIKDFAITGSIVWSTLLGEKWDDQDIDIFFASDRASMDRIIREIDIPVLHNFKNVQIGQYRFSLRPRYYGNIAKHCIGVYREFCTNHRWNHVKVMDLVLCEKWDDEGTQDIECKLTGFDYIGCSSNLRNGVLEIPDPWDTLFKRTRVRKGTRIVGNTYDRREKYNGRGITLVDDDG